MISHQTIDRLWACRFGYHQNVVPYMTQRLAGYHPPPTQHMDPDGFYYSSPESSYQHPWYDWRAPRFDQQAPRYDNYVPFASVSTGGSADGSLMERVVNNVCVSRLCIRTLADTATSADIYSPTRHVWKLDFPSLLEPKIRENTKNLALGHWIFGHNTQPIPFSPRCKPR